MAKVYFAKEKRRMKLLISRQDGYSMIAANIPHFQAIFQMPIKLDLARSIFSSKRRKTTIFMQTIYIVEM